MVKPVVSIPFDLCSHNRVIDNRTMDAVQRVVISPLFKIPLPPSRKHIISCNICHRRFNSQSQAEAHYKGNKHARMTKGREAIRQSQAAAVIRDNIVSTAPVTTYSSATASTEPAIDTGG
ncbi:zinc finger protein 385B-like [Hypanus sabinus]|uniref:zinc finger protein 385B-like n=1 Tax=Hypanus sabinus TaxID=79690 RepID=UPI0028C3BD66|nr:zinc finger protein 385B-like [Hypanus sabinus]